ncbi:hypothetical protein FXO38_18531 [Capsicum annuum]|nr:hypothetical protein FXO37_22052 [Capsicum annuum]KAF3647739.1 hypothetical protein FXO38_18531 [Capsicum annuum]
MVVQEGNIILRIFNCSVIGVNPKYEKFMAGMFSKFVYNNLHPTLEEVQRLDFLNRDLVEIYDPIPLSVPTTLGEHHGKRVLDAKLAASHSEPEGFKDFSTKPQTEILIKVEEGTDNPIEDESKKKGGHRQLEEKGQSNVTVL